MTYYCYILESAEGKRYIGSTDDMVRRLSEHNDPHGNIKRFTYRGSAWKIIHEEQFDTYEEARKRERKIKSWKGGRALKTLLNV